MDMQQIIADDKIEEGGQQLEGSAEPWVPNPTYAVAAANGNKRGEDNVTAADVEFSTNACPAYSIHLTAHSKKTNEKHVYEDLANFV